MKFKLTASQILSIVVAVIAFVLVSHYEDILPIRWHTYSAPDGSFSIDLPGAPETSTKQTTTDSGVNLTLHFVTANARGRAYTCSYVDTGSNPGTSPDAELDGARDGSIRNVQGTLLNQHRLTVQGYPAVEYQATARSDSFLDSRLVVVGNRLYMIMAVSASAKNRDANTIQRIYNSFKIASK